MASNPAVSLTCPDSREEDKPRNGSGSGGRCDSESDAGAAAKSLAQLCSRDKEERAAALEELRQRLLVCSGSDRSESTQLSKKTLVHLLRLSKSCPLQELRLRVTELLWIAQVTVVIDNFLYSIITTTVIVINMKCVTLRPVYFFIIIS